MSSKAIRECVLLALALAGFPFVALFAPDDPAGPLQRAQELLALEAAVGLDVEAGAYAWAQDRPGLLGVLEAVYLFTHLPALGGALVWTWLERPWAYARLRATVLLAHVATLAVYLVAPTAPPMALGGTDVRRGVLDLVQSPYAALPSGHVAFALLAGGTVVALCRTPWLRVLGAAYPVFVTALVVVTGNHFLLDAGLAALIVCGSAFAVVRARAVPAPAAPRGRAWRARAPRRPPARAA